MTRTFSIKVMVVRLLTSVVLCLGIFSLRMNSLARKPELTTTLINVKVHRHRTFVTVSYLS